MPLADAAAALGCTGGPESAVVGCAPMLGRQCPFGLRALALAAMALGALESDCGDRTGLQVLEACGPSGITRTCSNACGAGKEVCENGYWGQSCIVPTTFLSCSTVCGAGKERCADGTVGECSVPVAKRPCSSVCGTGTETCVNDAWGTCDAPPPGPPTLQGVIRDFHPSQPDFAPCAPNCYGVGLDLQIVEPVLGADNKPVYAGNPTTPTTHGKTYFDEWYNDTRPVNDWFMADSGAASRAQTLVLTAATDGSATYVYDNQNFFPIDGKLFDNQGTNHNYWFTLEVHSQIRYVGGETYNFSSDDDLWVFINRRLAVNLGGVHADAAGSVSLDEAAAMLGIARGQSYPLDLFYADREPIGAVLTIAIPTTDIWSCP